MGIRYGLDVGTNSIGWSVLKYADKKNDPPILQDMGVRIFSDGREPAAEGRVGDPKNLRRRTMRLIRRNLERRKRRKKAMLHLLIQHKYMGEGKEAQERLKQMDPYKLRYEALRRMLTNEELSRIMLNLAARRGFKSNRKIPQQKADQLKEEKGLKGKIQILEKKLAKKTLGEYLYELKTQLNGKKGISIRFRPDSTEFYPSREMYEQEFNAIKSFQYKGHPTFPWDQAYRTIFFQRPLRAPERGKCTFYPDKYRGYSSLPGAHRFRITQEVNNLWYFDDQGKEVPLTREQRQQLYDLLDYKEELSFDQIRKYLGLYSKFNIEDERRTRLKGNPTAVMLGKLLKERWDTLSWEEQDALVEKLITETDETALLNYFETLDIPESTAQKLLNFDLPVGVGNLSSEFMRDCTRIMREQNCRYDEAVRKMGLHHSNLKPEPSFSELPYYGRVLPETTSFKKENGSTDEQKYGRIPNPTVHVVLNQLRKLINELIQTYGKPDEIALEVTRELKLSRKVKDAIRKIQTKNQKENKRIESDIRGILGPSYKLTALDRKKYILWEELGRNHLGHLCLYCGQPISAAQLFNGDAEIEHILPFSRTLDDSMSNLTVAHKHCNAKKGNQTPFEAFGNASGDYAWNLIIERIQNLPAPKKRKFSEHALEQYQATTDFIQRQLTDTAYISRIARKYLAHICPYDSIWFVPGSLTAIFRAQWGFNTILNASKQEYDKNRSDHRHHALDALVIGLTDRSLLQEAAKQNANPQKYRYGVMAPPCPLDRTRVLETLKHVLPSIRPDHRKTGQLLLETAYGYRNVVFEVPIQEIDLKTELESILDKDIRETLQHAKNKQEALKKISAEHPVVRIQRKVFIARKPLKNITMNEITKGFIVDPVIRKELTAFLQKKYKTLFKSSAAADSDDEKASKKVLETALTEFGEKTGIKTIRYVNKNQEGMFQPQNQKKWYQFGDIAFCDIWAIPEKKDTFRYEGVFISRLEWWLMEKGLRSYPRPSHPAAKKLMRLFKNDIITLEHPKGPVYCRIAGFSTTQNKVDIQPLFATSDIKSWMEDTNKAFIHPFWKPKSGQNHVSINAIFKEFQIHKTTLSILGKQRRRY